MDYRGYKRRDRYFPVFANARRAPSTSATTPSGAVGEIAAGTGIEISMEVQFTAWLRKRRRGFLAAPWRERRVHLHRRQRARSTRPCGMPTPRCRRWLIGDYGLDFRPRANPAGPVRRVRPGQYLRPGLHHGLQAAQAPAAGSGIIA
ncbi:MAG: hypothetical protein U0Z44_11930 [Kouleothrix sp.]